MTSFRKISKIIRPYLKTILGAYYGVLHLSIMFLGAIVLLFDTNLLHLFILFIIVSVDAIVCVILHNCPLTMLEQKYLGHSIISTRMNVYKKLNISYECTHEYETTLEFLSNMAALLILKISTVMCIEFLSNHITIHDGSLSIRLK